MTVAVPSHTWNCIKSDGSQHSEYAVRRKISSCRYSILNTTVGLSRVYLNAHRQYTIVNIPYCWVAFLGLAVSWGRWRLHVIPCVQILRCALTERWLDIWVKNKPSRRPNDLGTNISPMSKMTFSQTKLGPLYHE